MLMSDEAFTTLVDLYKRRREGCATPQEIVSSFLFQFRGTPLKYLNVKKLEWIDVKNQGRNCREVARAYSKLHTNSSYYAISQHPDGRYSCHTPDNLMYENIETLEDAKVTAYDDMCNRINEALE